MSSAAITPITIAPTRINVLRELTPRPHSSLFGHEPRTELPTILVKLTPGRSDGPNGLAPYSFGRHTLAVDPNSGNRLGPGHYWSDATPRMSQMAHPR